MTANGRVTLAWGDGDHEFNIAKIAHVLELEDKCGCGVREILTRIIERRWYVQDIREVIRLSLIGGGKSPVEALVLVKRYFDERPWEESVMTAQAILLASIVGVPGDEVGKDQAEGTATGAMDALSAPPSTETGAQSDGPQEKPTKQHSGNSAPLSTDTTEPTAGMTSPSHQPGLSSTL